MAAIEWKVVKGDSSDMKTVTVELAGVLVSDYLPGTNAGEDDYYGNVTVMDKNMVSVLAYALAPDAADGFTVALSPAHTAGLAIGLYTVVFEVSRGTTPVTYRREMNWSLSIANSLINV